ncbi:MAG: hypothetical protein V1835_05645 [Candidatus Micrarchaeota archaeon]
MRGQLFSFDFIFAVSLLVFIFAMALYTSDSVAASINAQEGERELKIAADNAISQLLETPGNPSNWDYLAFTDSNVKSVGIAAGRNALNREKMERLMEIMNSDSENYHLMKRILALDLPASNFSISIYNQSQFKLYEAGVAQTKTGTVVSVQRLALLDDQPVMVNLRLWVEK